MRYLKNNKKRKEMEEQTDKPMLLLYCGTTRTYLFSPDEGSCYVFSTRNNHCEILASDGVILQSDHQSNKPKLYKRFQTKLKYVRQRTLKYLTLLNDSMILFFMHNII